jgi:single-strand DNA-binding protein
MKTKNRIDIIGYVGKDPEASETSAGTPIARFNVATTERWKGKDTQLHEHTDWHRVVFFGPAATQILDYVRKGSLVEVEGSLRSRTYEKDGSTRYAVEIRGAEWRVFDRRPGAEEAAPAAGVEPPLSDPPADDDLPL